MHDSLDGFANSKRPLTEVKEDPYEREEDFELLNSFDLESSSHGESLIARSFNEGDILRCVYTTIYEQRLTICPSQQDTDQR